MSVAALQDEIEPQQDVRSAQADVLERMICKDSTQNSSLNTAQPCGHVFHTECLLKWRRICGIQDLTWCPIRCQRFTAAAGQSRAEDSDDFEVIEVCRCKLENQIEARTTSDLPPSTGLRAGSAGWCKARTKLIEWQGPLPGT